MRAEKRRSPDLRGPARLGRGGDAGGVTPFTGMPAADPPSAGWAPRSVSFTTAQFPLFHLA
jgi:hypothetical protein